MAEQTPCAGTAATACNGGGAKRKSSSGKGGVAKPAGACNGGATEKTPARKNSGAKRVPGGKIAKRGVARGLFIPDQQTAGKRTRRAPVKFGIDEHVEGMSQCKLVGSSSTTTGPKKGKAGLGSSSTPACTGQATAKTKPCNGSAAKTCSGSPVKACNGGAQKACDGSKDKQKRPGKTCDAGAPKSCAGGQKKACNGRAVVKACNGSGKTAPKPCDGGKTQTPCNGGGQNRCG